MKQNTSEQQLGFQRDPDAWTTGDEPMTAAQHAYLETLARDSGEQVNEEADEGGGIKAD